MNIQGFPLGLSGFISLQSKWCLIGKKKKKKTFGFFLILSNILGNMFMVFGQGT